MSDRAAIPSLDSLEYTAYLNDRGQIPEETEGKIGIYGIFDREKVLQLAAYSRNVYLSLKQHLVRQPQKCYWFKIKTIERPSRSILEEIQNAWIKENGSVPPGNGSEREQWNDAIDAKLAMSDEEKSAYAKSDELSQIKLLKKIARRREAELMDAIAARGVKMEIRFNPKLKEQGLLDLK